MSDPEERPLISQYPPAYSSAPNIENNPPQPVPQQVNQRQNPPFYEYYDPNLGLGLASQNIYCQICGRNT